jgi:hypothetical protein
LSLELCDEPCAPPASGYERVETFDHAVVTRLGGGIEGVEATAKGEDGGTHGWLSDASRSRGREGMKREQPGKPRPRESNAPAFGRSAICPIHPARTDR